MKDEARRIAVNVGYLQGTVALLRVYAVTGKRFSRHDLARFKPRQYADPR